MALKKLRGVGSSGTGEEIQIRKQVNKYMLIADYNICWKIDFKLYSSLHLFIYLLVQQMSVRQLLSEFTVFSRKHQ